MDPTDAHYQPETPSELAESIAEMAQSERVGIAPDVILDVTGMSFEDIPHHGVVGGGGTLLCRDESRPGRHILQARGPVTFDDIHLCGPTPDFLEGHDDGLDYHAIHARGSEATFRDVTTWGFPGAGIRTGSKDRETEAYFEGCSFQGHLMEGAGYGVGLYNGRGVFESCYFNNTRHSITGFGYPTCSIEVRNCTFGPHHSSHAVDMHRLAQNLRDEDLEERELKGWRAGGHVIVDGCTFEFTHDLLGRPQEAITIKGIPSDLVLVTNNDFLHAYPPGECNERGAAYRQQGIAEWSSFVAHSNSFGVS